MCVRERSLHQLIGPHPYPVIYVSVDFHDQAIHTIHSFHRPSIYRRPDSYTCFLSFFLEMSLFPSIFCTIAAFSLNGKYDDVLSFRMVFFYLVTTGYIFDFSLCENSINQSIIQGIQITTVKKVFPSNQLKE